LHRRSEQNKSEHHKKKKKKAAPSADKKKEVSLVGKRKPGGKSTFWRKRPAVFGAQLQKKKATSNGKKLRDQSQKRRNLGKHLVAGDLSWEDQCKKSREKKSASTRETLSTSPSDLGSCQHENRI